MPRPISCKQPKAGTAFEKQVEEKYREIGAYSIKRNVNIDGHEIDVYAEVPAVDGTLVRTMISCKDLGRPAGVDVVREWNQVFVPLRNAGRIDVAVIVAANGFTQDAHAAATGMGVKLVPYDQLRWAGCDFTPHLRRMREAFTQERVFKEDLYIELGMTFEDGSPELPASKAIQQFLDLPNCRLLTILADYGGGKTTLCRKLFLTMVDEYERSPATSRLPIYINLRDYPRYLNLQAFLVDYLVNEQGCRCPNFATLSRLSEEGRILFILDAFDEMAVQVDYRTTLANFDEIARLFSSASKLLLTCRTHFFIDQNEARTVHERSELDDRAKKRRYMFGFLKPFTWPQIEEFVKKTGGSDWNQHLRFIRETYDLASLAEKPILLYMITDTLPELILQNRRINSTELYTIYTHKWLERDEWRVVLRSEDRLRFTITFAEEMFRRGTNSFAWHELERAVRSSWAAATKAELDQYQYDIRTCSFIRRSHRNDEYSFVHQSFLEYFVAEKIYEAIVDGDRELMSLKVHPTEVTHFIAGHSFTDQISATLKEWLADQNAGTSLLQNILLLLQLWAPTIDGAKVRSHRIDKFALADFKLNSVELENVQVEQVDLKLTQWRRGSISKSLFGGKVSNCLMEDVIVRRVQFSDTHIIASELTRVTLAECDGHLSFENCRLDACKLSNKHVSLAFAGCTCKNVDFIESRASCTQP